MTRSTLVLTLLLALLPATLAAPAAVASHPPPPCVLELFGSPVSPVHLNGAECLTYPGHGDVIVRASWDSWYVDPLPLVMDGAFVGVAGGVPLYDGVIGRPIALYLCHGDSVTGTPWTCTRIPLV